MTSTEEEQHTTEPRTTRLTSTRPHSRILQIGIECQHMLGTSPTPLTNSFESLASPRDKLSPPLQMYVEQAMKAHTIKMFKMYWKAVRDGGDHPNEPEKCDDKDNESEMSEDVDNPD